MTIARIRTVKAAVSAARCGAIAAYLFATIALTSSIVGASSLQLPFVPPPGGFLDTGLFAALGWGIWRFSRICAGIALVLYLFEQAVSFGAYGPFSTTMVVINVLLYLNGIRGAIAYHRFGRMPISAEKPSSIVQ
jgi:hypothetical protein